METLNNHKSARPDLSFITSMKFDTVISYQLWSAAQPSKELKEHIDLIESKIPELLQLAEMLFDSTLDKPDSLVHQMAAKTLNELEFIPRTFRTEMYRYEKYKPFENLVVGDSVECISRYSTVTNLTIGKQYPVVEVRGQKFFIITDTGKKRSYRFYNSMFRPLN